MFESESVKATTLGTIMNPDRNDNDEALYAQPTNPAEHPLVSWHMSPKSSIFDPVKTQAKLMLSSWLPDIDSERNS
jgi:hypothetical protein